MQKAGFTLIELSIVLVIIGLIVGAILIGQSLINTAALRATIGQIEKYNSAVNTFRGKYNCLPGDCPAVQASQLGFFTITACGNIDGVFGCGDGNGLINDGENTNLAQGECILLWRQLSDANLIDGTYGFNLGAQGYPSSYHVDQYYPAAKLGRGNYITAGSNSSTNFWAIAGLTSISLPYFTGAAEITPLEAVNIDQKVDDGLPNTGLVQARSGIEQAYYFPPLDDLDANSAATWASTSQPGNCITMGTAATDPTAIYNTNASSGGDTPACAIRLRWN
jgi:prepilin-type N-terminal cleavage/methylation domain-containing protein